MAERSGFFDAHLIGGEYDRVYLASSFARYFASFIGNGVFAEKSEGLMVYQTDPANMGVKVLPGQAWINGYWYENDSEFSLPVDIADGVLNRIDLVVLRWGTVERSINLAVKKGTPALNAVAPVLQRDSDYYELKLAEIRVTAGSASITQAHVVDTRADTKTCGWVTGVIDQVDTSELFAQWQAAYESAYAKTQAYHEEQKVAWERFFANIAEDSVFPIPSLKDVGKVPVVNETSDGYVLKDVLTLLGLIMGGDINMDGNKLLGLPPPTSDSEPATRKFVCDRTLVASDPNNDGNIVLQYGGNVVPGGGGSVPGGGTSYGQLTPEFANTIGECTDTAKVYVLPDGYIYAHMAHEEYPFTNQIPLSVDTDNTVYNGFGYKSGHRINSEGLEVEAAGARVTGYIPVQEGDVLYFKNIGYKPGVDMGNAYLAFYNGNFENVQAVKSSVGFDNVGFVISDYTTDEETGQLLSITVRDKYSNGVSYFRISSNEFDNTAIITVNEEITGEPVVTYRWTNTGHAFVPADYEDRIIKAENDIATLKQAIAGDIAVYGMVDEENNIVMTGTLTPGKYSLRYMNEDGTTTDIGEFTMW